MVECVRTRLLGALSVAVLVACGTVAGRAQEPAAEKKPAAPRKFAPAGQWKLVAIPQFDQELLVLKLAAEGEAWKLDIVETADALGETAGKVSAVQDPLVHVAFDSSGTPSQFKGRWVAEGKHAGQVLGIFSINGRIFPARLEPAEAATIKPPNPITAGLRFAAVFRERDEKKRLEKLAETLAQGDIGPGDARYVSVLLAGASKLELTDKQVTDHVQKFLASAEPYGSEWTVQCRLTALRSLQGQKSYAALCVSTAQDAVKGIGAETPLEMQAQVYQLLSRAATLAEQGDLAKDAEATLAKIDARLDEEYVKSVPPFKPDTYTGRAKPEHTRVVLFELFTGAECPPCVAADVAFDALLKTYQPTELIGLQYHLHIPGPDPLTTPDSLNRARYYGLRGTPSTFFNGRDEAGGGGGMAGSRQKYDQYREVIDGELAAAAPATLELQVERSGSKVNVTAQGTVPEASLKALADRVAIAARKQSQSDDDDADKPDAQAKDKPADKPAGPRLRLRLALTEETLRYVGGNRLRFHHHVVRGLPGGVEGLALEEGRGTLKVTVDLDEVRQGIETYLTEFQQQGTFSNVPPKSDFAHLHLVAFLQEDVTKEILHAVTIPIPEK